MHVMGVADFLYLLSSAVGCLDGPEQRCWSFITRDVCEAREYLQSATNPIFVDAEQQGWLQAMLSLFYFFLTFIRHLAQYHYVLVEFSRYTHIPCIG